MKRERWHIEFLYAEIRGVGGFVHADILPQVLTLVAFSIVAVCVLFLATNSKRS